MRKKSKKPQTLKQRIRSLLWDFLLEETPDKLTKFEFKVDGKAFKTNIDRLANYDNTLKAHKID